MSTRPDSTAGPHAVATDPEPTRPIDLDYPALGRLVESEADSLVDQTGYVREELAAFTTDLERPAASPDTGPDAPRSVEEIVALLNGIGAGAYRLARHVRTLVEFRALHVAGDRNGRP